MYQRLLLCMIAIMLVASCRDGDLIRVPTQKSTLVFAFYNLENLFDPADDPAITGDNEFTPNGRAHWNEERLERKLENIARAIRSMDEHRGPDLIGLCEVENRRVLELLRDEFLPAGAYAIVHADSHDDRGIDVALLYRPAVMQLVGYRMHNVVLGEGFRPTRDIMEATFRRDQHRFTVLVNHWPSRSEGREQSEPKRIAAAQAAAAIIDSLYRVDPAADIVLMGDLNDEPFNTSVKDVLDAYAYDGNPFHHHMMNTAAPVAEVDTIGSYFYRGDWNLLDQIMVSRGVLDSAGLTLRETVETVFAPDFLRDERADPQFRPPYRTYRGSWYIGGTSDHFPVMLRVGWGKP
jgi:predicted extracellular nuclease